MGSAKQRTGEGKASVKQRLTRINRALSKFEGELERTVRTLIAKGGHSRQELKSLFDDVIERLRNGQIYALASGTRGSIPASTLVMTGMRPTRLNCWNTKPILAR